NFKDKEKPSKDNDQILNSYQKNILYLLVTINSYMNTITDDAGGIIKFRPIKHSKTIYIPDTIDHSYMRKSLHAIGLISDLDHKYDEDYVLTMEKLISPFSNLQAIFNTISTEKAHGSDDSYNIDLIRLYHEIETEKDTNQSELSIEDNKSAIPSIETQKNWLNDLIYKMDIKITEYSKLAIEKNKVEDIDLDDLEKKMGSILLGIIDRITEIRTHKGFKEYENLQKYIDALRIQGVWNAKLTMQAFLSTLLIFGNISDTQQLWNKNFNTMVEDLAHRGVLDKLVPKINNEELPDLVIQELDYQFVPNDLTKANTLNEGQYAIFNEVLNLINCNQKGILFVDEPAG
ncbi:8402_t:CDS:2, partial [Racocetra fulgida]